MQCESYFPVCHSHYDLNGDVSGGARSIYNGNGSLQNRHCNNYMSSLLIPQGHLPYGKEFLRQTMLVQELTFRDQVQELHRLYRRQKELMSEIRSKEIFTSHLHLEAQFSNSLSSKFLPNCGQNSRKIFHLPNSFHDLRTADAGVSKGDSNKNNLLFLESRCKKVGGRFLDLELPGELYIDSEDQESLEDAGYHEAPTSASSSNKLNTNIDKIPENVKILERSLHMVDRENVRSNSAHCTCESDTTDTDKAKHVSMGFCQETSSNSREKNGFVVQAFPCSTNPALSSKGCRIKGFLDEARSLKSISFKSKSKDSMLSSEDFDCSRHGNESNCIDLSADSMDGETTRKIKKCRLIDINLPYEPDTKDEPLIEDDDLDHDSESLPLNNSNDDGSPLTLSKKDIISLNLDLDAPPSPKVEEGPPPRVDSEENLPKVTPNDDPLVELDKAAAEIIVSMSLSKLQPFLDTRSLHTLEWFADVIHSVSVDPTYGLDDFEAMTLNLTEMKVEEHWCHNSIPSENVNQTRKGRTRRPKRKDFQREVLPSLASLSRYEVTEDIQMIEGLMETNGTPWQLCKTRRGCRMKRRSCTIVDQSCIVDVVDSRSDRVFVSWGKVPRGARGHRSPGNHSKWFDQLI